MYPGIRVSNGFSLMFCILPDISEFWIYFCLLWGLPAGCVCDALPAALQNPQKKHALEFWSMYLMGFIVVC